MVFRKTIKNSISALISYIIVGFLMFLSRKVFLNNVDDVFLGYEGVFGNVIEIIALSTLGLDIIIYSRLENAYGECKTNKIGYYFDFYKKFLHINLLYIVIISTCIILLLYFSGRFTPVLLISFVLLLMNYYCQLFISLYRMIMILVQDDYVYSYIDLFSQILSLIIRIIILLTLKNYLAYLSAAIGVSIIEYLTICFYSKYKYKNIFCWKMNCGLLEFAKKYSLIKDVKNNFIQKVSLVIYGATDNIVIATILGVNRVTYLSNYYLISGIFNSALMKITDPFQSAIGKIVNSPDKDQNKQFFNVFNTVGYIIGCFTVFFSSVIINDVIQLYYGYKYVVAFSFVLLFSINQYIAWNQRFLSYYRYMLGKFEIDKVYLLVGTALNVIISIPLAYFFGISGVILGTLIGHISIWIGRVIVIYKVYIFETVKNYVYKQIVYFFTVIMDLILFYLIYKYQINGVCGYIIRWSLCFAITGIMCLIGLHLNKQLTILPLIYKKIVGLINDKT